MSVIIHGLNMPKDGRKHTALLQFLEDGTCRGVVEYSQSYDSRSVKVFEVVPLPEGHGDLIDRDAFRADYGLGKDCENCDRNTRNCNYDICLSRMDVCGWIDDAPTIVPAEGDEADGN